MMEKKTKQLVKGDMVRNPLDGKFYEFDRIERAGAGYTFHLLPANVDGNNGYCEHSDRFTVQG